MVITSLKWLKNRCHVSFNKFRILCFDSNIILSLVLISKRLEEEKDYQNKEKYVEMYEKIPGYLNQVFTQIHSDLSH